ncbi:cytochrome c oxidase subunit II [Aliirhizobium cellulosilyticum]|uniref:Cytochrome aa3 subunit 2 n=1 Tax=Aliirhizobium cellulosilyticum TaxID=393664 RepID=A0A7W6TKK8_9HYPH|nr:cytochrome c oxidase subunit II [Rhizobium cellulosilyticum]MBB4351178.1 cytochrome c oxidase subunit 2 [Rhizobium cellulosilyticum]MBB4414246.1 cytochrome c oxidase subunit 2 [Rhizobium cellulosilyticum]MBB4448862.1 cytochrome c oxidase subunit 2 [Rhizobium cellulosilyticum]
MTDGWATGLNQPRRSQRQLSRLCPSLIALLVFLLTSCSGNHSALDPAGPEAVNVAQLFFVMLAGGVVIWLGLVAALIYAARKKREHSEESAGRVILWGGAVIPTIILCALLSYGMWLMPAIRPWVPDDQQVRRIEVTGEQFWWRVRYLNETGEVMFETANEVRIPVGQPAHFSLKAADVIHSFWVPSLGGKMDMIPGRTNPLTLTADREGTYRGVCAEFCGESHALMAFTVRAVAPDEHDAWLAKRIASTPHNAEGLAVFLNNGCGACHAVSGTAANGRIGPDLTAFGERSTLAAGTLPHTAEDIASFIAYPGEIKPGVKMPHFGMLPEDDIKTIAAFLKELK